MVLSTYKTIKRMTTVDDDKVVIIAHNTVTV